MALDPTTVRASDCGLHVATAQLGSSQPLFDIGFLERNPRFTTSGLPFDSPVSYAEGKRTIARDSAALFGRSVANNAACAIVERVLFPGECRNTVS